MGIFATRARPDRREPTISAGRRASYADPSWDALANGAGGSLYGATRGPVAPHVAEALSAVTACVELITGAVASLPASIVDADGNPAPATLPAVSLIQRPNRWQSWPAFIRSTAANALLAGNAVCWIQTDGRGAFNGLTSIPWQWLSPQVLNGAAGPRLAFDVTVRTPAATLLGLPRRLLDSDVMHIRGRSDDGIIGRSVIGRAAGVVTEGSEIATLAASNWRNGMRPSGVLSSPSYIPKDQRERAKEIVRSYQGALNAGSVPLLEGGWTFSAVGMNSQDAEFLASRQFSVAEIARLFCVPEPLIQLGLRLPADLAPFTAALAQFALAPLVDTITAEFTETVLPAGYRLQLDLGGLLRGAFTSQVAAFAALVQSRIATPNDARSSLGLPQHPDGDTLTAGPAPSYPADAPGLPSLSPKPGPTGGGLPEPGTNANEGAG